jgi:hypothetical protein
VEKMRNIYNILVGKLRHGWQDNIKIDFKKLGGNMWSG